MGCSTGRSLGFSCSGESDKSTCHPGRMYPRASDEFGSGDEGHGLSRAYAECFRRKRGLGLFEWHQTESNHVLTSFFT